MKKILYRILRKDMIKKLKSKHFGEQFIDTVMNALDMPTNFMDENYKNLRPLEGSLTLDDFPKDELRVEGGRL